MTYKTFTKYGLIAATIVLGTALLIQKVSTIETGIGHFFSYLTPFYIGFVIAYILNPILNHLENGWKLKRGAAIAATYLVVLLLIGMSAWWLIPQSIVNILAVVGDISKNMSTIQIDSAVLQNSPLGKYLNIDFNYYAGKLGELANIMFQNLSSFLLGLTAAFFNTFMGIIISIYMAIYKKSIIEHTKVLLRRFFPEESAVEIEKYGNQANEIFSHFLTGLILDAIIVGILAFMGFALMGVKYAATLGLIICFTNLIPYFGPLIGAIPAFISTVTYDPMLALWVLVFIFVLREVDANLIGPRIMKSQVGLSPLWILFFITVFGGFWGAAGIILAIPTGALLKVLVHHALQSGLLPNPVFQKRPIKSLVRHRRGEYQDRGQRGPGAD